MRECPVCGGQGWYQGHEDICATAGECRCDGEQEECRCARPPDHRALGLVVQSELRRDGTIWLDGTGTLDARVGIGSCFRYGGQVFMVSQMDSRLNALYDWKAEAIGSPSPPSEHEVASTLRGLVEILRDNA